MIKRWFEVWQESVTIWPQEDHVSPDLSIFQMDVGIDYFVSVWQGS